MRPIRTVLWKRNGKLGPTSFAAHERHIAAVGARKFPGEPESESMAALLRRRADSRTGTPRWKSPQPSHAAAEGSKPSRREAAAQGVRAVARP